MAGSSDVQDVGTALVAQRGSVPGLTRSFVRQRRVFGRRAAEGHLRPGEVSCQADETASRADLRSLRPIASRLKLSGLAQGGQRSPHLPIETFPVASPAMQIEEDRQTTEVIGPMSAPAR